MPVAVVNKIAYAVHNLFELANSTGKLRDYGAFSKYGLVISTPESLAINFIESAELDTRITFTRASSATRVKSTGLIETVSSNVPRFDYDPVTLAPKGLLIEEQRTNLLTYSEQFDNGGWTKTRSSITANMAVDPQGFMTADKLVIDTTASTNHNAGQNQSVISGTTYTWSVYAKAAEFSQINLRFGSQFPAGNTFFDLSSGTKTNFGTFVDSTITNVGNGWYRCSFTATANASGTAPAQVFLAQANGITITTANETDGVLIWGAQLEAGAFPTSYIPTTTAAATRAADVAVMTGSNFSSWYNQTAGSFVFDYNAMGPRSSSGFIASVVDSAAASTDYLGFSYVGAATNAGSTYWRNGGAGVITIPVNYAYGEYRKYGVSFDNTRTLTIGVDGSIAATATSTTDLPTVNTLNIGRRDGTVFTTSLWLRRIAYYPRRLSNAELKAITS